MKPDNGQANREMRTFHCELAHAVQQRYRSRCPCCDRVMVRGKRGRPQGTDAPTVAHDEAIGVGGDETVWVYACRGCNGDQRNLSFRAWAFHLACINDPRAQRVLVLAEIVTEYRRNRDAQKHGVVLQPIPAYAGE